MYNPTPVQPKDLVQKSSRFRSTVSALIVLLIIAGVASYLWYSLRSSCEVNAVKEASAILSIQLKTYDQVFQVAVTASRASPDHPVNTLKQILMDTQEVTVPGCMQTAKKELINYMGTVILAFQAYRTGEADATVMDLVRKSDTQFADFKAEMRAVNKCAPFCLP
jgi:hypothetical protein